jgi:hypothetical protein
MGRAHNNDSVAVLALASLGDVTTNRELAIFDAPSEEVTVTGVIEATFADANQP